MATYLLVAHQTAESPELRKAARDLTGEDPDAQFVLLVPATPVASLLVWEEGETLDVAERRARSAARHLQQGGIHLVSTQVGDANPLHAIADELRHGNRRYATIVISTLPVGASRWLGLDLPSRARRQFPQHTIVHVSSSAPVAENA
jgi:hypothetical protein